MNKRALISGETISWFWKLPAVFIVAIFLVGVIGSYRSDNIELNELEDTVLSHVLRFSPNCLAVKNEQEVDVGVIDVSKMEPLKLAIFGTLTRPHSSFASSPW